MQKCCQIPAFWSIFWGILCKHFLKTCHRLLPKKNYLNPEKGLKFEPFSHQKQTWGLKFDTLGGSRYIYTCFNANRLYFSEFAGWFVRIKVVRSDEPSYSTDHQRVTDCAYTWNPRLPQKLRLHSYWCSCFLGIMISKSGTFTAKYLHFAYGAWKNTLEFQVTWQWPRIPITQTLVFLV